MSSSLLVLNYVVQWKDFQVLTTPPAGQEKFVALTHAEFTRTGGNVVQLSSTPPFFTIGDNLVLRIFMGADSWRLLSLSYVSGKEQVWLIKHEQGHYDIEALLVRDFYWRIRSLMGTPFSSTADITSAIAAHANATINFAAQLQIDYDHDTENSQNRSEQWAWWDAIDRARQLHRVPLQMNADGQYLRIELMDALRKAKLTAL